MMEVSGEGYNMFLILHGTMARNSIQGGDTTNKPSLCV
jgi:hypothetical protein